MRRSTGLLCLGLGLISSCLAALVIVSTYFDPNYAVLSVLTSSSDVAPVSNDSNPPPTTRWFQFPQDESGISGVIERHPGFTSVSNASLADLVLISSLELLAPARAQNSLALINWINSPCTLVGSGKLACFWQFATVAGCEFDKVFSISHFGKDIASADTVDIVISSVLPFTVYVRANITSDRVKWLTFFVVHSIRHSLMADIYRLARSFQLLALTVSDGLIVAVEARMDGELLVDVVLGTKSSSLIELDLSQRFQCPRLISLPFESTQTTCSSNQTKVGSANPCASFEGVSRTVQRGQCGFSQALTLDAKARYLARPDTEFNPDSVPCPARVLSSWSQASEYCLAAGARLCTLQEIQRGLAANTGCLGDFSRVWTATRCSDYPVAFWTAIGSGQDQHFPPLCLPMEPGGFPRPIVPRCCAETERPSCVDQSHPEVFTAGDPFVACPPSETNRSRLACAELWYLGATKGRSYCVSSCAKLKLRRGEAESYCLRRGARLCSRLELQEDPSKPCDSWTVEHDAADDAFRPVLCCADKVGKYCDLFEP